MRRLFALLICLFFLTILVVPVQAHPGKTDSNGGHKDYSTGEYHFHHGYSAHNHRDMDGDGSLDCPYDFNDQTGINSGSPSSGSSSRYYATYDYDPPETISVYKDREVIKEVLYTPSWIKLALAISVIWLICLLISSRWKKQDISELEARIRQLEEDTKKQREAYNAELLRKEDDFNSRVLDLRRWYTDKLNKLMQEDSPSVNKRSLLLSTSYEDGFIPDFLRSDYITVEYWNEYALELGISKETAVLLINQQRYIKGLPPIKIITEYINTESRNATQRESVTIEKTSAPVSGKIKKPSPKVEMPTKMVNWGKRKCDKDFN